MVGATQDITEKTLLKRKLDSELLIHQREITSAVLEGHEKERAAIGIALQENLSQMLVAVNMYIGIAKKNEDKREIFLDKSTAFITEVIVEIKKIHRKLTIPDINVVGFYDSIQYLIDDAALLHHVRIELLKDHVYQYKLSKAIQLNIYRVIQEQINNIIAHAEATNAIISLSIHSGNILTLLIKDNGKGWDNNEKTTGLGLNNIVTRVGLLNGKVTINSKPGQGFMLKAVYHLSRHHYK